jgi:hypothetical protein
VSLGRMVNAMGVEELEKDLEVLHELREGQESTS